MDGLPGLQRGVNTATTDGVKPMKKMVGPYAPVNGERRRLARAYTLGHLVVAALVGMVCCVGLFLLLVRVGVLAVCVRRECEGRRW
jgi:hypothetical protein